jgi:hypothetical protein
MANQTNNLLLLPNDGITRTIDATTPDVIQLGVDTQFIAGASVDVDGNLTVRGGRTTLASDAVLVSDNYVHLNNGYESDAAESGGIVVNYDPTTLVDTVAAGGFTAGVPGVSNPNVATTGAATFATSDIIQINGSGNDGLYEVLSHVANVLTIRGIGTTGTVEAFTQDQFVTDPSAVGSICKVAVSVIRANTSGVWQVGSGSVTPIVFATLATGGSVTLQQAYANGNTITTSAGDGNLTLTTGAGAPIQFVLTGDDLTIDGANNVDIGGSTPVSTFSVVASGSVTIEGPDDSSAAIGIGAGGLDYITIDSTNGAECVVVHQDLNLAAGVGFAYDFVVGTGGMTAGDLMTMEYGLSARVIRADANDAQEEQRFVVGVAKTTTAATGTGKVHTVAGQIVPVRFGVAPLTVDNGRRVYLSTTAGIATLTAPVTPATSVFQVGVLVGGDGLTNPADVIYLPQFIARRP